MSAPRPIRRTCSGRGLRGARWLALLAGAVLVGPLARAEAGPGTGPRGPSFAGRPDALLPVAERLTRNWRFAASGPLVGALIALRPQDPRAALLAARWFYLQGHYGPARRWLAALQGTPFQGAPEVARMAAVVDRMHGAARLVSPSGRVVLVVPNGGEALLAHYAFEALERAQARLATDWGLAPIGPVRVEVLPGPDALAAVSPLSEDEVRRTGTIALAADNRIWLVTPRALVTGYAWIDTLVHEYVHHLLETHARGRVPLWLHEGLARYGQSRWRAAFPKTLPPAESHRLAEARAQGGWVPLARMSPSFAKLRDGREAALAYAQVFSMVLHLVDRSGQAGIRRLLQGLAQGRAFDRALRDATGLGTGAFVASWRASMAKAPLRRIAGYAPSWHRYRDADRTHGRGRDAALPAGPVARQRRLGALLRARGHLRAAVVAYRRAFAASGHTAREAANPLGRLLLQLGQPAEALRVAEQALRYHPETAALQIVRARAAETLGLRDRALDALHDAVAIDPFDPEIHCRLARIEPEAARRQQEAAWCRRLQAR